MDDLVLYGCGVLMIASSLVLFVLADRQSRDEATVRMPVRSDLTPEQRKAA